MKTFTYEALPARVIFGFGTLERLPEEVARLGISKALVLATPAQAEASAQLADGLADRSAGVFTGAVMHTPIEVTERALALVEERRADGIVAIGGGSTIGLGKAIAIRTDLPQLAVPTTYAGSEMTPILGETKEGIKTTQRSPAILPETVIYDVELTLSLPPALSGTSGINAIAHGVEAFYAKDKNPIISLMAEEGVRALAKALPRIAAAPRDREAREQALYGAWLCAVCLGAVGMALHHKLCHVLGGSFDLPHAATHAVVLPHAVAYNREAAPEAMRRLGRALGADDPAMALYELAEQVGAARALSELGMPANGIDLAVDLVLAKPYWNPRPVERAALRELIGDAWTGRPPDRQ